MSSVKFEQILETCLELFELEKFEQITMLLDKCNLGFGDTEEWQRILKVLERFPKAQLNNHLPTGHLFAKALRCLQRNYEVIEFAQRMRELHGLAASSYILIEAGAGWNLLSEYEKAYVLLDEAIPHLLGQDLGIALSRRGFAAYNLKKPWEENYKSALRLLTGEELGRALLNYGYCLSMSGQGIEARRVWLEALTCFKRNPYFLAWIRYNLATVAQNDLEAESERHLLAALEPANHPKAQTLRAIIWNALGKFRIELGEWKRAEFAFLEGRKSSEISQDKELAYRGIIRSQYLSGHLDEALETLETALHEPDLEQPALLVAQAKVYLKLNHPAGAKAALEKAGQPKFELEMWPWRVASAELARQQGQLDEAATLLEGLPLHTLHAREEVRQFPLLFELLHAAGKPIPEPLDYVQGTTVAVQAGGVLRVSVNGRPLALHPTSRVGELLVFLLEQGGVASLDTLEEALYGALPYAKRRRQAVWNLIARLREALGWQDSVIPLRGAYQLDPKATWHYDIAEARRRKEFRGEFLAGIYTDWALETARELQELAPPTPRKDWN